MKIEDYLEQAFGYKKEYREKWIEKINEWQSWYCGYNKEFYNYTISTGRAAVKMKRKSLQMAKKCCEDWADLLFNVNCKIEIKNNQEELNEILAKNNFWLMINQAIEKSFAVGTGALILSVSGIEHNEDLNTIIVNKAEPCIEFVEAEKIYPISWNNQFIYECAFSTIKVVHGQKYLFLSVHTKQDDNYVIHSKVFTLTDSGEISELKEEDEKAILGSFTDFNTESDKRWFCIISPAISSNLGDSTNGYYSDYPFGISVFANAVDCIKSIDETFDSLSNEIQMGRKRIFVRSGMLNNVNGQPMFDATDISVYELPDGVSGSDLFQPDNSALRVDSIVEALKTDMSAFSNNVGMGKDMYSFEVSSMSTAAQVYSTNSELKRHRDKHKTKIENELYDFLDTTCYASTKFSHYNISSEGLSIKFDDSMFEDLSSESQRKLNEINGDVAARYEYRTAIFNEDEETAKAKIAEIDEEKRKAMMNMVIEE